MGVRGDSGATGGHRLRGTPPIYRLRLVYIGVRPSLRLPPFVAGSRPRYPPLNPHFFLLARFARSARTRFGPGGPPLYPLSPSPTPPPQKRRKEKKFLSPKLPPKKSPEITRSHPNTTPSGNSTPKKNQKTQGLISPDRNNKATLLLTIPG
ncbi:hypothetical protein BDEG_28763 [Batrachochytrium dendrobatidis JEL423]|uniref:Uncharacterized protein n=1 Tax=Batrachochytrium dendrobatidis (strain JEL423) TaxID=403673 RepID=A0A177VZG0_BATDL|nr:hypothetical protein BDEG_28763 [Batrachochytrium dendrobatidis JEL423]